MSQYGKGETAITDPECLVLALNEDGWTDLEVHAEPQHLVGYQGDQRAEKAHIIIRRKHISRAANDVGFFIRPDGTIESIISQYDSSRFNATWMQNITKLSGIHKALKNAKRQGKRAERLKHEVTGKDMVRIYA